MFLGELFHCCVASFLPYMDSAGFNRLDAKQIEHVICAVKCKDVLFAEYPILHAQVFKQTYTYKIKRCRSMGSVKANAVAKPWPSRVKRFGLVTL